MEKMPKARIEPNTVKTLGVEDLFDFGEELLDSVWYDPDYEISAADNELLAALAEREDEINAYIADYIDHIKYEVIV